MKVAEDIAESLKSPPHNRRGQLLRGKGLRTRTSILVEMLKMLPTTPLSDVTVANVTKRLGLNAAAFYPYFSDMGEAMIAAYECVLEDAQKPLGLIEKDWPAEGMREAALQFVDAFFRLWRRYAHLLRARNALADAGDTRFVQCRRQLVEPMARALVKKLEGGSRREAEGGSSMAVASLLFMTLERAATVCALGVYGDLQPPWPDLRLALAEMFEAALTERSET